MTVDPKFCSNCGNELPTDGNARYCSGCGTAIQPNPDNTTRQSPVSVQIPYKSPGTAMLIAVIGGVFGLLGIGHIYVGRLGRGIVLLIIGLILYGLMVFSIFGFNAGLVYSQFRSSGSPVGFMILALVFGIAYLAFLIWQILDVRDYAKEFNELAKEEGQEPW